MSKQPSWLADASLQEFFAATAATGGEARAVGGAVRDYLMGRAQGDVDLASTLLPEQTMTLAAAHGWKAIPTGIAHGTVTVVLPGRIVEVTTLRRDVETDGRHAVVSFTQRFEEDAARRDFTFNALYMNAQGDISDYFGGKEDLAARRVKFIGDAATRIKEDGLRMLRYFRFLATHGSGRDENDLAVIREKRGMIETLSGERIATEMGKLLAAKDPLAALTQMNDAELAPLVSNASWRVAMLQRVLQLEAQHHAQPMLWVRLLAMVAPAQRETMAMWVAERWKLSRADRTQLLALAEPVMQAPTAKEVKAGLRAMARGVVEAKLLLAAVDHPATPLPELLTLARGWAIPAFPVVAADLLSRGFVEGYALGDTLRELERSWMESDYTLDKEALLNKLKA